MSVSGDAYRKWLGVDAANPTPRELLQLPEEESSPQFVRAAADLARRRLEAIPAEEQDVRAFLTSAVDQAEQTLLREMLGEPEEPSSGVPSPAQPVDSPIRASTSPPTRPASSLSASTSSSARAANATMDLPSPARSKVASQIRRQRRRKRSAVVAIALFAVATVAGVGGGWMAFRGEWLSLGPPAARRGPEESADEPESSSSEPASTSGTGALERESGKDEASSVPQESPHPSSKPDTPTPLPPPSEPASNEDSKPSSPSPDGVSPKQPPSASTPTMPPDSTGNDASAISEAEWDKFRKHYRAARAALVRRDFKKVEGEIAAMRAMKVPSEAQAIFERLVLVVGYARQFHDRLGEALSQLKGSEELTVMTQDGERRCAVVEATPEVLVLRVAGRNRRFPVSDLPSTLALTLVHRVLDATDPVTRVVDGAYLATLPEPTAREVAQAKEWWRQARSRGVDIGNLEAFFDDMSTLERHR